MTILGEGDNSKSNNLYSILQKLTSLTEYKWFKLFKVTPYMH